ncbi:MAG: hypothetical protein F4X56_00100 [Gammaproteobacteria bacterium]|nr:hypothetical protein [Gammaproteobacteria bacterium]
MLGTVSDIPLNEMEAWELKLRQKNGDTSVGIIQETNSTSKLTAKLHGGKRIANTQVRRGP